MTTTITGATGINRVADGADMPAGSVIQMVEASTVNQVANTSANFVTTDLSVAITPTSADTKLVIMVGQVLQNYNTSNYSTGRWKIVKTQGGVTSDVFGSPTAANGNLLIHDYGGSGVNLIRPLYMQTVVTSGSTTARTYFTQIAKGSNGGTIITAQPESQPSSIIIMEIAG